MFRLITCIAILLGQPNVYSQYNIIPNADFELYVDIPDHWYYNGTHFTEIVQFWSSPTAASPDAYGKRIDVPRMWSDKGFGHIRPHNGDNMVGLTVYGCAGAKPHCREYIQIRLSEPLVPGQNYTFSYWTAHLENSCHSNNLGVYFSVEEIHDEMDIRLNFIPLINEPSIIKPGLGRWLQMNYHFKATESSEFLTMGNFYPDEKTKTEKAKPGIYDFAYYYLDDLILKKAEPMLSVPREEDKLANILLEKGERIVLDHIYFDYDRADFLRRSYVQLHALLELLRKHPELVIEVHGHTDNSGSPEYNNHLSVERSKAVVSFLIESGISAKRLSYRGYGSSQPIASNDNYDGRKKNRRVEFVILDSAKSN